MSFPQVVEPDLGHSVLFHYANQSPKDILEADTIELFFIDKELLFHWVSPALQADLSCRFTPSGTCRTEHLPSLLRCSGMK